MFSPGITKTMDLTMEARVLAVSRYDIPGENGRPAVRGTKIKYLGDKREDGTYLGFNIMEVNGPYELFERFSIDKLPGIYKINLGQKMSNKKPVLTAKDVAFTRAAPA